MLTGQGIDFQRRSRAKPVGEIQPLLAAGLCSNSPTDWDDDKNRSEDGRATQHLKRRPGERDRKEVIKSFQIYGGSDRIRNLRYALKGKDRYVRPPRR